MPLSVTSVLGQPKYGKNFSSRVELTAWLLFVLTGLAIVKPVAASTSVHIATCPSDDLGMSTRSMCILSPMLFAEGVRGRRGALTCGLAGLALLQVIQLSV